MGLSLAVGKLAHLDDRGLEIATALREWLDHLIASETGPEEQRRKNAFFRMAHETAFTYLNRLAALRMCEERGLVIECVRRGMESDGFALYERLAGQALGDRGQTYRLFLECMCDELAVDLGVLFDRRVPHSLVFPSPACIAEVLQRLNDKHLAHLWQEDETIGWLYQYFNSRDEIDRMRKKELGGSPSPRNSRELAVRNQFFTPRYVVEFLTDNTLGRIWYEMQQGETVLKNECRYLVRRPHEIFLGPNEQPPETASTTADLSQEERLQRPVYIRASRGGTGGGGEGAREERQERRGGEEEGGRERERGGAGGEGGGRGAAEGGSAGEGGAEGTAQEGADRRRQVHRKGQRDGGRGGAGRHSGNGARREARQVAATTAGNVVRLVQDDRPQVMLEMAKLARPKR